MELARKSANITFKIGSWPAAVAVVAFAVRLAYALHVGHQDPLFNYLKTIPDAHLFDTWAREIVARRDFLGGDEVFFIGPFYAYFLAFVYSVVGRSLAAVRAIQIVADVATTLFIYGFAKRVADDKAARAAALIYALYLPAIFFAAQILPVAIGSFLAAASLYFLARGVAGRWWNYAGAGAALGFLALDRPNVLAFVPVAIVVLLSKVKKIGVVKPLAFVVCAALPAAAAAARNYAVAGDWVVVSSQGGIMFYLGNAPEATGVYWPITDPKLGRAEVLNRDFPKAVAERVTGHEMKPGEISRWWFARGLHWLRENPGPAARLYLRKLRLLINDFEVGLNEDFYFVRYFSPVHQFPFPWFAFLFSFAVLGFAIRFKGWGLAGSLASLFVAVNGLGILAFMICSRYRMPAVPALAVFAGAGVSYFYQKWRAGDFKRAVGATAAVVGLGFVSCWPVGGISRTDAFGREFYNYGKYYLDIERPDRALALLERAPRLVPGDFRNYFLLAVAYEALGREEDALATVALAARRFPDEAFVQYSAGVAYAEAGRTSDAVAPLKRAVALRPDFIDGWIALGDAAFGAGDYATAVAANERLTRLAPGEGRFWLRRAEALFHLGDERGAHEGAARAHELDASIPPADAVVGGWFYRRGDYERALSYFRRDAMVRGDADAWSALALTYEKLGRRADARKSYKEYLSRGGDPDESFEERVGLP